MQKFEVLGEWRDDLTAPSKIVTAEKRLNRAGGPVYRLSIVRRFRTKAELVEAYDSAVPRRCRIGVQSD